MPVTQWGIVIPEKNQPVPNGPALSNQQRDLGFSMDAAIGNIAGSITGGVVYYGANVDTPRPATDYPVVWIGSTGYYPNNAIDNDIIITADANYGPRPIDGGYKDLFNDEAGQAPSGWTEYWNTGTATPVEQAGGYLNIARSSIARWGYGMDPLGNIDGDCDAVMRFRYIASGSSTFLHGLLAGGSGPTGDENGVAVYCTSGSPVSMRLGEYVDGTFTNNVSANVMTNPGLAGVWLWLRLNITGTTASGKLWKDGDEEPAEWGATTTVSGDHNGWGGIFGGTDKPADVNYIAIVTGTGRTAPLPQE